MHSNSRKGRFAWWVSLACCTASVAAPLGAQQIPERLANFLHKNIGLDAAQIEEVAAGKIVVKVLDTPIKRDVAVFGIIPVDVPRDFYVARVLRTAEWLRVPTRPHFGVFSDPAQPADVQDVTIDRDDVHDLRDCRPGHCNMKLPGSEMQRIREAIDWSVPDPGPQVDADARQGMLTYVTDYRMHGDSAMVEYDDTGHIRASEAFRSLLAESPFFYQYVAPFHDYLVEYPNARLDGVTDVLYWSVDSLRQTRPILTITHLSVYAPPDHPGMTVVAQKQIYADHFFEAGLDLMLVVERPTSNGTEGVYLVVVRRFRFDSLSGGIFDVRGRVISGLRHMLRTDLEREKKTSEQALDGDGKAPGS